MFIVACLHSVIIKRKNVVWKCCTLVWYAVGTYKRQRRNCSVNCVFIYFIKINFNSHLRRCRKLWKGWDFPSRRPHAEGLTRPGTESKLVQGRTGQYPYYRTVTFRLKGTWQWGGFSGVFEEIGSSSILTPPFEPFWFWLQIHGEIRNQKTTTRLGESLFKFFKI